MGIIERRKQPLGCWLKQLYQFDHNYQANLRLTPISLTYTATKNMVIDRGWFNMEQDFREMDRTEFVKTLRSHYGFVSENENDDDGDWAILEQWESLLDGTFMKKPTVK